MLGNMREITATGRYGGARFGFVKDDRDAAMAPVRD